MTRLTLVTLKGLAQALEAGAIQPDALILPRRTADQATGWLYREREERGHVVGEYADAGQYEILPAETAAALERWRDGGPSPFRDERLCLYVEAASHIVWKAEQAWESGGA